MKKLFLLGISLFTLLLITSCEDENETVDSEWRLENEAKFASITTDPEYTKLNSTSGNGHVMYKVIETGDGDRSPYFTEQVRVRYTGWFKYNWEKEDTYQDDKGNHITNKIIFDTTSKSNIARTFNVKGVVDGFSTALQHMKEGDKWEVWIPWNLGYLQSGNGSIPGYTTLVFEIELVEIVE